MRPTKEGIRFLLATLLIAVAAFNTGNNLIFLILAMMLSMILLSVVILRYNLKGLTLAFSTVHPVFVKNRAVFKISLSNKKKLMPSYSIHVTIPKGIAGQCVMPYVPPMSNTSVEMDSIFTKRGIYRYGDFTLESSFPFTLFRKNIKAYIGGEVIVYPEIKEIDELIPELTKTDYTAHTTRHAPGDEFLTIREFRYGDSMRRIQWKASAKTGKLMVKDTGTDEPRLLTIILDNIKPLHAESFEKAISFAASLADRFIRLGFFVRLITCKKLIPFGSGLEHLFKILDALAVIDEDDTWECPMMDEMHGTGVLILKSDESALKKAAPACSMVVYAPDL